MRSFAPPRSAAADRKSADRARRPAIGARQARAPRHLLGGAGARREEPTPAARSHAAGGLPERLQTVMEAMSGFSLADVVVHRNSAEPARLGAAAFTKGDQIHLAPGQERQLTVTAYYSNGTRRNDLRQSELAQDHSILLPIYAQMIEDDQIRVASAVRAELGY